MKDIVITTRISEELDALLDDMADQTGRGRSAIVREALTRHLTLLRFEHLRRRVLPFAEACGYLTDEDVFDSIP